MAALVVEHHPDLIAPLLRQPRPLKVERAHAQTEAVREDHRQRSVIGADLANRQRHAVGSGDHTGCGRRREARNPLRRTDRRRLTGGVSERADGRLPASAADGRQTPRLRPSSARRRPAAAAAPQSALSRQHFHLGRPSRRSRTTRPRGSSPPRSGWCRAGRPSPAAVGSPVVPGPKRIASSPSRTSFWPGPRSTTNWSMQTRPTLGRRRPLINTSKRPPASGTPRRRTRWASAPPWCPGRRSRCGRTTHLAGLHRRTSATGHFNVIAGRRPMSPRSGIGVRPYTAIPVRTMSKARSGRVRRPESCSGALSRSADPPIPSLAEHVGKPLRLKIVERMVGVVTVHQVRHDAAEPDGTSDWPAQRGQHSRVLSRAHAIAVQTRVDLDGHVAVRRCA